MIHYKLEESGDFMTSRGERREGERDGDGGDGGGDGDDGDDGSVERETEKQAALKVCFFCC